MIFYKNVVSAKNWWVFDDVVSITLLKLQLKSQCCFHPKNLEDFRKNNYPITIFKGKVGWRKK